MKELMLCVILFAAGTLAQMVTPEPGVAAFAERRRFCYTKWFDRDNPSGYGDYETFDILRDENPGKICRWPYFIEVRTLTGVKAKATRQVFQSIDTTNGFVCVNSQQGYGKRCFDYKVRFACPCWRNTFGVAEAKVAEDGVAEDGVAEDGVAEDGVAEVAEAVVYD